jgi:hypothetical protein
VGQRGVDEDYHPFLEVALAAGCSVHRHHRRTGVVVVSGYGDIVGTRIGNRTGHDRGSTACPADSTSGLWAGAARHERKEQDQNGQNILA